MPKIKPHKGLKKRVKITASGKVLRKKANKGHLMSGKTGKRRRRLGRSTTISKADIKNTRRLLGKR